MYGEHLIICADYFLVLPHSDIHGRKLILHARVRLIPVGLDDIIVFVIRADVDYEELIKDPKRVQDHIVAVTGLKDLPFGDFTYLSIWVSASYIECDSLED
jgi:hypothetical protein